jgi:hypothetical protein
MIDISFGITEFRDRVYHASGGDRDLTILKIHKFNQSNFTTSTSSFEEIVSEMFADGGGPEPESSYDAIYLAVTDPDWKDDHLRVVVHITDATPNIPDLTVRNIDDLYERINGKFDQIFHLMPNYVSKSYYSRLKDCQAKNSNKKAQQFFEELNDNTDKIIKALIKIAEVSSSSLQTI